MSPGCTEKLSMPADNYAWDPDYMGSSMMVPVLYVTWFMAVIFVSLMGESHIHACICCTGHVLFIASHVCFLCVWGVLITAVSLTVSRVLERCAVRSVDALGKLCLLSVVSCL